MNNIARRTEGEGKCKNYVARIVESTVDTTRLQSAVHRESTAGGGLLAVVGSSTRMVTLSAVVVSGSLPVALGINQCFSDDEVYVVIQARPPNLLEGLVIVISLHVPSTPSSAEVVPANVLSPRSPYTVSAGEDTGRGNGSAYLLVHVVLVPIVRAIVSGLEVLRIMMSSTGMGTTFIV